jgi:preprotein translocase subunit SecE
MATYNMTRIITFFREVRHEMSKVIWPSKRDTIRYTATIIIFSLVISVILGAADLGLIKGLELILNK